MGFVRAVAWAETLSINFSLNVNEKLIHFSDISGMTEEYHFSKVIEK